MWDVIDTILVLAGLGFLAWFWWTAGRTVLELSGRLDKQQRIRAWFVLARGCGLALAVILLVFLIQHLATGTP